MSTLSVAATAQPTNSPPRVKVDVTDTGTPEIFLVTVVRTDTAGRTTVVRTYDGNPLQLVTSGSTRVATIYDTEMPFGQDFTYSTLEQPANKSGVVSVTSTTPWLVHVGIPSRSVPVDLRPDTWQASERSAARGVFRPLGRANAVVSTDGQRKSRAASLTVRTETPAAGTAMELLIDDAGVLLLQVPPSLGYQMPTSYIAVGDVQEKRPSDIGAHTLRDWELPYVTVDRPAGGAQAQWTWADVIATYPTWQALIDAKATWADVLIPPS